MLILANRFPASSSTTLQPVVSAPSRPAKQASGGQGDGFHAFWNTKAMQDSLRGAILEVLRSPEGEEILTRLIRKELDRRK